MKQQLCGIILKFLLIILILFGCYQNIYLGIFLAFIIIICRETYNPFPYFFENFSTDDDDNIDDNYKSIFYEKKGKKEKSEEKASSAPETQGE